MSPRLIAGKVIDWVHAARLPERAEITGNQCTSMAKRKRRMIAETKAGKERPRSEAMRAA